MTRPEIIRADSIDLQDREAPSAQTHHPSSRLGPTQTKQTTDGSSLQPHQAETLREVAAETAEDLRSPRASWVNGDSVDVQQYAEDLAASVTNSLNHHAHDNGYQNGDNSNRMAAARSQQDDLAVAQNGGTVSHDNSEDGDMDGDGDDMDDDMDKISSSPSINSDGASNHYLPQHWPPRVLESLQLHPLASLGSSPTSPHLSEARSSSPYLDHPDYLPLQSSLRQTDVTPSKAAPCHHRHDHHLPGEYPEDLDDDPTGDFETIAHGEDEAKEEIAPEGQEPLETEAESEMEDHTCTTDTEAKREDPSVRRLVGKRQKDIDEAIGGIEDYDDGDLIFPYEETFSEEDDDDDVSLDMIDPRFVDSGWGGECLHGTEEIDFEFVYALHTFIATVEGQANATKGDTMVLLDDSNSYWWLVRVVKDSSIGYLPAEHIETPSERLARLNKYRNGDLTTPMLGDQADKGKSSIKTILARKAKRVAFAAPTYVDYSDFDYTTEEEDEAEADYYAQQQGQAQQSDQTQQQQAAAKEADDGQENNVDTAQVAPLKPRAQQDSVKVVESAQQNAAEESSSSRAAGRTSEEIFETNGVEGPKKKADGTVRDSFFKDDTVETKKITLTPNLLRDDGTVRASTDSNKDLKQRPSLDKLDKDSVFQKDEKKKGKDKKEKEKKGGFRSLFSRKDKKQKGDEEDDSFGKRSMDVVAEVMEKEADDRPPHDDPDNAGLSPQRNASKLQKQQPRVEPSPTRKVGAPREPSNALDLSTFLAEGKVNNVANVPPSTMRIVEQETPETQNNVQKSRGPEVARSNSLDQEQSGPAKAMPVQSQGDDVRPQHAAKAMSRMQLDDSDSDDSDAVTELVKQPAILEEKPKEQPQPQQQVQRPAPRPTLPGAYPDSYLSTQSAQSAQSAETVVLADKPPVSRQMERLSESPVEVSPITPGPPPGLMVDTSSPEDRSSPVSSPSPELIEREDAPGTHRNQDSITTSTSTTTVSSWNDTSLRAFFDSGSDIRDMLAVVYDTTDVEPVGPEHPVAGSLFREQNAKLAEITTQLDNMLGDWLARKQRLRGTV